MRRRNEMDVCSLLGMHTCLSVLATASSASPDTWLEKLTALALKTEPGILCVPASYQSQLSDIRGPQYNHICNHTHTLKHAHAQMHHPSPAGKLWIGFGCLQQPAAVQESTPAHAFSVVGSFLLQGNKVGGIAKDQYLFWCNRRVNRTVFILDSENCSFLPHLLAIYKRNLN